MSLSPLVVQLIDAMRCLPGVGPKSAQRMAFHLLERDRDRGSQLGKLLIDAMQYTLHCDYCRNFSEAPICNLCLNPSRDTRLLCIVESPADVLAIEQTAGYRGLYFVLMGHLSPLDGIGPSHLGLDKLNSRLSENVIQEVILATNLTVEGEATAHYIANLVKSKPINITRIAHGVPSGGELEYVDGGTLNRALQARVPIEK